MNALDSLYIDESTVPVCPYLQLTYFGGNFDHLYNEAIKQIFVFTPNVVMVET